MNKVLESCKFVVEHAKHVKINKQKLQEFCRSYNTKTSDHWMVHSPFSLSDLETNKDKANFLFIHDAIGFCFWGDPKWEVEYKGKNLGGSYGLIAALAKALGNGIPILDIEYLSNIEEKELRKILEGNVEIPLFKERHEIIKDVCRVLLQKFEGDFTNVIKEAGGDVLKFVDIIVQNFSSFNDISEYKGQEIFFYKRAQLLTKDVYAIFNDKDWSLKNISEITACADYKIPFVLRRLGVLEYSDELANKIDAKIEILKDSEEEVEIRASMVWAVELMRKEVKEGSQHIDDYLWLLGKEPDPQKRPYHHTRTIAY